MSFLTLIFHGRKRVLSQCALHRHRQIDNLRQRC